PQAPSTFLHELCVVAKTQLRRYPIMDLEDLMSTAIVRWLGKPKSKQPNTLGFPDPDKKLSDDHKKFFAKICHDILIDHLRHKAVEDADLPRSSEKLRLRGVDHAELVAEWDEFEHMLTKLHSIDQIIFKLHILEGCTFGMIASKLGMLEGT